MRKQSYTVKLIKWAKQAVYCTIIKTVSFSTLSMALVQWTLSIIFIDKSHQLVIIWASNLNSIFWSKLVALLMARARSSCPWCRGYSSSISDNRNASFSDLMAGSFVVWSSFLSEPSTCNFFADVDSVEIISWFFKISSLGLSLSWICWVKKTRSYLNVVFSG